MVPTIAWPASYDAACERLIGFIVLVVAKLGVEFPPELPDPLVLARASVEGTLSEADHAAARERWWSRVDELGITSNNRPALIGRLALCLLTTPARERANFDEYLDWFFEVLDLSGLDTTYADQLMRTHFAH